MTSVVAASLLDPGHLIASVGLLGLLGLVFAECGLLVGFFLPGDSLLFTAGLLVANGSRVLPSSIALVCALVVVAAIAGNLVGYGIGRKAGPRLFARPDSKLFRPEYVERTNAFFERYGGRAVLLSRFVPIVRTFITAMAGAGGMRWSTYVVYSVVGGVLWGAGVTLLGYWLGQVAFVSAHIELILIGVVLVSVLPIIAQLLRQRVSR